MKGAGFNEMTSIKKPRPIPSPYGLGQTYLDLYRLNLFDLLARGLLQAMAVCGLPTPVRDGGFAGTFTGTVRTPHKIPRNGGFVLK